MPDILSHLYDARRPLLEHVAHELEMEVKESLNSVENVRVSFGVLELRRFLQIARRLPRGSDPLAEVESQILGLVAANEHLAVDLLLQRLKTVFTILEHSASPLPNGVMRLICLIPPQAKPPGWDARDDVPNSFSLQLEANCSTAAEHLQHSSSETALDTVVLGDTEVLNDDNGSSHNTSDDSQIFDVFLAHNSRDKPAVERLAQELSRRQLRPWIDSQEIAPGKPFQESLQDALRSARAIAICIGESGLGKWQDYELKAAISRGINQGIPVIPVLLPGANTIPSSVPFLAEFNWVKFKESTSDRDAIDRLVWGITGSRPVLRRHSLEFTEGVLTAPAVTVEDDGVTGGKPGTSGRVLFGLHGIRTHAQWTRALSELASDDTWQVRTDRWTFGYFNILQFLTPWARSSKVAWFREVYRQETQDRKVLLDKGQYPSIVAHSFGTFILGNALLQYDYLRFNKIVLCGSILPRDFPWDALLARGQVQAVRNEYGVRDIWVRLVGWLVADTAPSGSLGFTCIHERLEQEEFPYTHSEYFDKGHMEANWLPFLNRKVEPIAPYSQKVKRPRTTIPLGLYALYAVAITCASCAIWLVTPLLRQSSVPPSDPSPPVMADNAVMPFPVTSRRQATGTSTPSPPRSSEPEFRLEPAGGNMYTFHSPDALIGRLGAHNITITRPWLRRLQLSAVRFNYGGSGSFVSADGLILTNHHVAADALSKLSPKGADYLRDGYYAASRDSELRVPDLSVQVLVATRDVTQRINDVVTSDMDEGAAHAARRKAMDGIEKEANAASDMRNDVITFYSGGMYYLYTYKVYDDIRVVFAPESAIAFFGGDADNFEYPRYDLDICFLRAYEGGKPANVDGYLSWNQEGAKEGDVVFLVGNPGRTDRRITTTHLKHEAEVRLPFHLEHLREREAFLLEYSRRGPEQSQHVESELFGVQNTRKAREAAVKGLQVTDVMRRKQADENSIRSRLSVDAGRKAQYRDAWDQIAEAQNVKTRTLSEYWFLEREFAFQSKLFHLARMLVRLADESAKPDAERLREFQAANRESLEMDLYSDRPINVEFEKASVAHALERWRKKMPDHPLIEKICLGRSAEHVAEELVAGTRLGDLSVRRTIGFGGVQAISESNDAMIALAKVVDPDARAVRSIVRDQVESVESLNYARIARMLFDEYGESVYPDATFTLRMSFGVVRGYEEDGRWIDYHTTIGGAFEHADANGNREPFKMPDNWIRAKQAQRIEFGTPFNFVSTADIVGGNSGSPVVDLEGALVGVVFDGNLQSLVLDYGYDDSQARAISVDSRAILEALRAVYQAHALVRELREGRSGIR